MNIKSTIVLAALSACLAVPVSAQDTAHLRGEVAAIDGQILTVDDASGKSYDVTMTDGYTVFVYQYIDVSDVKTGDFLSIPSVDQDGMKTALSINVFPEDMRGTGEGERAWDLTEESLMTNATVGEVVTASDGTVLSVFHSGKTEPVLVPEDTPITRFAPDPDRQLETGDQVLLFVEQVDDGIAASLAGVSADGSLPPV